MTVVVNRVTVYQLSWGERLLPPTGLGGGGEGQIGEASCQGAGGLFPTSFQEARFWEFPTLLRMFVSTALLSRPLS